MSFINMSLESWVAFWQTNIFLSTNGKKLIHVYFHRDIPKTQTGTVVLGWEFLKADKIQKKMVWAVLFLPLSPPQKKQTCCMFGF